MFSYRRFNLRDYKREREVLLQKIHARIYQKIIREREREREILLQKIRVKTDLRDFKRERERFSYRRYMLVLI